MFNWYESSALKERRVRNRWIPRGVSFQRPRQRLIAVASLGRLPRNRSIRVWFTRYPRTALKRGPGERRKSRDEGQGSPGERTDGRRRRDGKERGQTERDGKRVGRERVKPALNGEKG
ncbi:hypothetical protein TNCV_1618681 [Trichonephila clavipes]|nr:hypothetical protein TNCV_1618681 [Trichonephila clavipes]